MALKLCDCKKNYTSHSDGICGDCRDQTDNERLSKGRPVLTMAGWAAEAHKGHSFGLIFSLGRQVDEEVFYYFLDVVYPAAMGRSNSFLVGEASYHTPDGLPVYSCFTQRNDKYYHVGDMTIPEFNMVYGGIK